MFLPIRISLKSFLSLTFGILLTQSAFVGAEDGHQKIQPVPESQAVRDNCPHCQSGQVSYGNCPSCEHTMRVDGHGYGHCGNCNRRRRMSPGTGWCAPGKVIIQRQRVQYWKYYPNYWSGYGPGAARPYAPMVYTPTDTSQLGYYYQHAPTWTTQPWRTPGPAHPAAWHNRFCGRCGHGLHRHGGIHHHGYGGSYCPSCQAQPIPATAPDESHQEEAPPQIELPKPDKAAGVLPRFSVLPNVPPEV